MNFNSRSWCIAGPLEVLNHDHLMVHWLGLTRFDPSIVLQVSERS